MLRHNRYTPFFIPTLVFLALFTFFPVFYMVGIAFTNASLLTFNWKFVGFRNFVRLFTNEVTPLIISNTLKYVAIVVLFQFIIGFTFAVILNAWKAGKFVKGLVGAILFLPWVFSDVIAVGAWKWMFNDTYGMVNYYLMQLGFNKVNWFADPNIALFTLIMLNIWKGYPFSMVLEHAGLQTIPNELYEAAKIDGAGQFQSVFRITIPLMKYIIFSNIVLITIYTFNMFNLVYAATKGDPLHRTEIIGVYMYNEAFNTSRIGYSASIALVMTVFNTLAALLYLHFLKKKKEIF